MILVDTSVLVDVWTRDPLWGDWSAAALAAAVERDGIGVNPVIYAELSAGFETEAELSETLAGAGIRRLPLPYGAAWHAGRAFATYRKRGGSRLVPLPDFFIGAHALCESLPLLTRDASRVRTYFPAVRLIAPRTSAR